MNVRKSLNLVLEYYQKRNLKKAEDICRKILKNQSDNIDALHFLGIICFELGDNDYAIHCIKKVLELDPYFADAYNNLGNIFQKINQRSEAILYYQKALQINPELAQTYYNLGLIFQEEGKPDDAIHNYQKALQLRFNTPGLYNNLGLALHDKGKIEEAIKCYQSALHLNPDYTDAHYNLGNAFKEQGSLEEAVLCYQKALQINPNYTAAYNNLGNAFQDQGKYDEAITYYKKALLLNPDFSEAYFNLGNSLREQQNLNEAITNYNKAISRNPRFIKAYWAKCISQLPVIYSDSLHIEIARDRYREELLKLRDIISSKTPEDIGAAADAVGSLQPFLLACQGLNDRELQQLYGDMACNIMALQYPQFAKQPSMPPYSSNQPLRIGMVSRFFYWHSVWKIPIKGWLENMNKERFHIYGYYTGRKKDKVTETARKQCYCFVEDIYSFEELCRIIRNDNLHALIYPEIGMDSMTLRLASLRLAPVQCVTLGHPDTTGLPTIDYYLSSDLMETTDADEHYTENLIRLPNLGFYYMPLDVPSAGVSRETFGLRSGSIIYLCSHALFTHLPQYDVVYPSIARENPDCQFVFISDFRYLVIEQFRKRLMKAFSQYNLNADDYVVILPRLDQEQYYALNCLADVFLDTIGWSANNSTFEAIACNIPIVTLPGKLMRQRHCTGILTMMGLTETIATTIDEYIEIASQLGRNVQWRHDISEKIKTQKYRIYQDRECIAALEDFLVQAVEKKK